MLEMHFIIRALIASALLLLCYSKDIPCNKVKKEFGFVCLCNETYCDTISPPAKLPAGEFHIYSTSENNPGFNHASRHFKIQAFSPYGYKYFINIKKQFQTIRGFGGSFTDSVGVVLSRLSNGAQDNLLGSYFSEEGIEYSVCRVVLGASDFSLRFYSYIPDYDPSLKSFKLTEDDHLYKIPHIKRALNISSRQISLIGTTWAPPDWMKINNETSSQFLKKGFRQHWADYHIKVLDAFKAEGVNFWGITTGNEPISLFVFHAVMPNVVMFPEEQREWVIYNLGPALKSHNYSTKMILMDDQRSYALWWMETNLNHWVTTFIDWNLSLDLSGGPNVWNYSCDATIIVNETANEFYKQPAFYAMGHFSKFIQPGSKVINVESVNNFEFLQDSMLATPSPPPGSTTTKMLPISPIPTGFDVTKVGVLNPDGSRTIIYYNPKSSPEEVAVFDPDRGYAFFTLEPKSVNSIVYW